MRRWRLQDRVRNVYFLSGTLLARGKLRLTVTEPSMPLNNKGDEILLIERDGMVASQVAYGEFEVRAGKWVEIGE
jgi:hypothetical protein